MDNKSHEISPTPSTILFDDPLYLKDTPKFHTSYTVHHKMRKGCRNDYIVAFGAVNLAKGCLKKS